MDSLVGCTILDRVSAQFGCCTCETFGRVSNLAWLLCLPDPLADDGASIRTFRKLIVSTVTEMRSNNKCNLW